MAADIDNQIRLSFNPEPVCPHCAVEQNDAHEIGGGEEGDFVEECQECGGLMLVSRHITWSYSTRKDGA